jgi:hypothetical protein
MVKVCFQGTPGVKVIALKRRENVQQFSFFLAIFTQYIVDVFTLHKRFSSIKYFTKDLPPYVFQQEAV